MMAGDVISMYGTFGERSKRGMARRRTAVKRQAAVKRQEQTNKEIVGPTPEQRQRANYELNDIVDVVPGKASVAIGKAYRREPYFEELARRDATGIGGDDLRCLRFYRNRYEASLRSPVRSVLNRDAGGAGEGPMLAALISSSDHRWLEREVGALVHTLRAIALEDKSYAQVAMERWGSREQDWIVKGESRTKIVPKSGKHPTIIRDEFLQAVARLTVTALPYIRTG
ncbi:hypothetical protein [Sphingobium sp. CFD-2]|uniref:hypothetical protein n=1 Tax=Sphingobium sp. CFD-2 TaxID=2878542 RepID=UPI00214C073D|nr:hypothetical protein [Sphingobium sp. CFD-2]